MHRQNIVFGALLLTILVAAVATGFMRPDRNRGGVLNMETEQVIKELLAEKEQ